MNSTTEIVGWAPEPRGRGTIGLLWNCFVTIFLCTWSAIHPNLPGLNETKSSIISRRVYYVIGCLVTPEFSAWLAMDNLVSAMQTREKAKAAVGTISFKLWARLT
jgi:hypothetical protein